MAVHTMDLELVFPPTKDCEQMRNQIDRLIINQDYWAKQFNEAERLGTKAFLDRKKADYNLLDCDAKIVAMQVDNVKLVADTFKKQDQERINADIEKQANNRKLIGVGVILSAVLLIILMRD